MKRFMMFAAVLMAAVTFAIAADTAKIGKPAPAFELQDQNGKTVTLAEQKGKIVVLEWFNNDCPYVVRHYEKDKTMATLSDKYSSKDVVWLAVNSTHRSASDYTEPALLTTQLKQFDAAPTNYLMDEPGAMGKAYGAKTTPHMFVISPEGKVLYNGAIDDKRSSNPADARTANNYVRAALTEAKAGKPVTVASTAPYGCSVKY